MLIRLFRHSLAPSLRKPIVRRLDAWMRLFGYQRYSEVDAIDFRGITDDPVDALNRALRLPVLVELASHHCRGLDGTFPMTPDSVHPFVMTAKQYLIDRTLRYSQSHLGVFYATVQPGSVAELMGLPIENVQAPLRRMDAIEGDFPWRCSPGPRVKAERLRRMHDDAAEHGRRVGTIVGWHGFGPVPRDQGQFEFQRLTSVVSSILERGYHPDSRRDHLTGVLMIRGKDFRLLIRAGQHRAAALVALGHETFPIIISPKVVERGLVEQWPGVASGAFSRDQALAVFDRVFDGHQPEFMVGIWPQAGARSPANSM